MVIVQQVCNRKDVFGNCISDSLKYSQNRSVYNSVARPTAAITPNDVIPAEERKKEPAEAEGGRAQGGNNDDVKPFGGRGRGFRPPFEVRPNITELPEDVIELAKFNRAASIYSDEGLESAQQYLEQQGIEGRINDRLSGDAGIVFERPNGDVNVAYRGTRPTNINDLKTDVDIIMGSKNMKDLQHVKTSETMLKGAIDEYGLGAIRNQGISGYSLGGGTAIHLGSEYNIPTTTFNPLLGKSAVMDLSRDPIHTMYRTTTDFASIGAGINPKGFNINTIQPFEDSLNPIVSHSLDNFLSNTKKGRAQTNSLHEATGDVFDAGVEMAQLHNRIEDRLREAREGGQEETKGGLTADENEFLQGIEEDMRRAEENSANDFERQQNVSEFINSLDPEDRVLEEIDLSDDIRDHRAVSDRLNESIETVNEAGELHARAGGGLVGALHPVNIGGGLVGWPGRCLCSR